MALSKTPVQRKKIEKMYSLSTVQTYLHLSFQFVSALDKKMAAFITERITTRSAHRK
jgi:hypothetical protein